MLIIWDYAFCQTSQSSFFGQDNPGDLPMVFAEGIVTYPFMNHSSVTINSEMNEIFWSKWYDNESRNEIVFSKLIDNIWTNPKTVPFSGKYSDDVPFLSPDNKRLYFISRRPINKDDNSNIERIWYTIRIEAYTWSEPIMVSSIVNCEHIHWQFSVAEDYTIYYNSSDGIKYSEYYNGDYQEPKLIKEELNKNYLGGNPFISPKRDYIVFSSKLLSDSRGKNDLYIGFKMKNGFWSNPINLGDKINGPKNELCPIISPHMKYMFFIKQVDVYDIYWVKTSFIEELKYNIENK